MNSSSKVHDASTLHSLQVKKTRTLDQRFHDLKADMSKQALTLAYRLNLGYTTLTESYDRHNSDLFREIVIEAVEEQRKSSHYIFSTVIKGNLYEVKTKIDEIEKEIRDKILRESKSTSAEVNRSKIEKGIENSDIYSHDVGGANIVHLAFLMRHFKIGHYLVKRYPKLACQPYSDDVTGLANYLEASDKDAGLYKKWIALRSNMALKDDNDHTELKPKMLYTGENILHILITQRNYEEMRWLLDFYSSHRHSHPNGLGTLLKAKATGMFFDRGSPFYFGLNPLHFAVCSNNINIFDLVYSFVSANEEDYDDDGNISSISGESHTFAGPDVIFATDQFGNNILHLCVMHALDKMYEHVHSVAVRVMATKIHSAYIAHDEQRKMREKSLQLNPGQRAKAALSAVTLREEEDSAGYVMKETVLFMPEDWNDLQKWVQDKAKIKVDERLVLALNEDFHSPLTLAASILDKNNDLPEDNTRKVEMFRFLVNKMKVGIWDYGPIGMALLNLDGIEIKYDVLNNYECEGREHLIHSNKIHSALWWLCKNDADQAVNIPEITQLIQAKWERVGYPLFILSFLLNMFLTACVTLILIFINATPTTHVYYETAMIANVLYAVVTFAFFIMLIQEINDVLVFKARLISYRGVPLYDKALRLFKIGSFIAFCCCKAAAAYKQQYDERYTDSNTSVLYNIRYDQGIKVSMVVCVIASYLHLYYFFMGFDATGPFVLTMFRIISRDVPYFMNFYLIVVIAFACALSMLSNDHNGGVGYGFFELLRAVWTLIQTTVGVSATHDNINSMDQYPQHLQWLADILLTFYNTSVIILMLNLLIAMISNTYNAYCEYNDAILLMAKYNIMNSMEWVMWPHELKANRSKYAQVDERKFLQTVNGKVQIKTKPCGAEAVPVPNAAAPVTPTAKSMNASAHVSIHEAASIDTNRQICYTFEMRTVRPGWCDQSITAAPEVPVTTPFLQLSTPSAAKSLKTTLFIIAPQVDFHPGGSLAVPNADADSVRIAQMIDDFGYDHIHDIVVAMDSHYPCHIAHAGSWMRPGQPTAHPALFSFITNEDIVSGVWVYRDPRPEMQAWVRAYTSALERKGRMILTIWPEHCLVGSAGHSVVKVIDDALQRWAKRSMREVGYVMKGQNLRVENYSFLVAEVEDPLDLCTGFDHDLMSTLQTADRLLICGQALSHCVNYTTRDIISHWNKGLSSIILLTDGTSPVFDFETEGEEFKNYCMSKGLTVCPIATAFAGCKAETEMMKQTAKKGLDAIKGI